jgi:hypothetical protein
MRFEVGCRPPPGRIVVGDNIVSSNLVADRHLAILRFFLHSIDSELASFVIFQKGCAIPALSGIFGRAGVELHNIYELPCETSRFGRPGQTGWGWHSKGGESSEDQGARSALPGLTQLAANGTEPLACLTGSNC